ncbi:MAG: DHH family phosphoesterase, partial [Candidatus Ratteibacteria bacterium]|nr:DHH family phosphoesterase [Candidatus Ratteibacteria bacterium]
MGVQLGFDDSKKVSEIVKILKNGCSFLLTTHRNIDGDAIGSELALYSALKREGKEVVIVNQDNIPAIYKFLPWGRKVYTNISGISVSPDVAIVIDCGFPDRTGNIYKFIKKAKIIINIDHHFSNSCF